MRGMRAGALFFVLAMVVASTLSVGAIVATPAGSATVLASHPLAKISPSVLQALGSGQDRLDVLIATAGEPGALVASLEALGGTATYAFEYVDALAASVPSASLLDLARSPLVSKVYLDVERSVAASPSMEGLDATLRSETRFPMDDVEFTTLSEEEIGLLEPNTYYNYVAMNADDVWAQGSLGQSSLAVIIDTGIWSNHFMLRGSLVGGVDMSPDVGTEFQGFDRKTNHWHGSHVAGILAGHGAILLKSGHPLLQAIKRYSDLNPQDATQFGFPGFKIVPLLGLAPFTGLYIIKVFPHTGAGVSESRIIAAIEHAIDLKVDQGVDVDIISMSLGGANLFDGRDLEDQTVDVASSVGITVVSAAGNDGPAPMSVSSPGTAHSGVAAAAAAHPVNTKVFWDWSLGSPGIGQQLFVSDTPQIIYFSSRGPTSDGRMKPDLAATGIFVLSAFPSPGSPNGLAFASGTSMATPAVSGAVSLLTTFAEALLPAAAPEDFKQALRAGASDLPGYGVRDEGSGFLDAGAALQALRADASLGDTASPLPPAADLADITNLVLEDGDEFTMAIENLAPGIAHTFVFAVREDTSAITVSLSDVDLRTRNPLGLNSFEVYIQSAKRTTYAYYIDSANAFGDASFTVTDQETTWSGAVAGVFFDPFTRRAPIEPGFVKVVIENDWTSAGPASGTLRIAMAEEPAPAPDLELTGSVADGNVVTFNLKLPKGATGLVVELWWANDWSVYPTADLDLVIEVKRTFNFDGATLNAPERAAATDLPKVVKLHVVGFTVWEAGESFSLRVTFTG